MLTVQVLYSRAKRQAALFLRSRFSMYINTTFFVRLLLVATDLMMDVRLRSEQARE